MLQNYIIPKPIPSLQTLTIHYIQAKLAPLSDKVFNRDINEYLFTNKEFINALNDLPPSLITLITTTHLPYSEELLHQSILLKLMHLPNWREFAWQEFLFETNRPQHLKLVSDLKIPHVDVNYIDCKSSVFGNWQHLESLKLSIMFFNIHKWNDIIHLTSVTSLTINTLDYSDHKGLWENGVELIFESLTNLVHLSIENAEWQGEALSHISSLTNLKILKICASFATSLYLKPYKSLRVLDINNSTWPTLQNTDIEDFKFLKDLNKLTALSLSKFNDIDTAVIIEKYLPNCALLNTLQLFSSNHPIANLSLYVSLTNLNLNASIIYENDLDIICNNGSSLKVLELSGCELGKINKDKLFYLTKLTNLIYLSIDFNKLNDNHAEVLKKLTGLRSIVNLEANITPLCSFRVNDFSDLITQELNSFFNLPQSYELISPCINWKDLDKLGTPQLPFIEFFIEDDNELKIVENRFFS